ncbi:MAG TPA: DUF5668 domain-containing protein, partial [Candidatus Saccharimonadales bacterium]|nr:DUF5668 domain-containing protein [Candidatus Saccharimonadales bacterium]
RPPLESYRPQAQPPRPRYGLDPDDPRRKNPALAGILSAMPGLGQIYVGYYPRGFAHALVVGTVITIISQLHSDDFAPLLGLFLAFFWLYNIIDAIRRATLYNQVLAGGDIPSLPDDIRMPSLQGSLFGGVALLAAGFVLLMHTRFGMPLDFVEDWWPLAPMALGAYLLARAVSDRRRAAGDGGGDSQRDDRTN